MRACEDKRVRPHVYREPCSQLKCVEFVFVIKKIKTKSLYIIEIFDPNQCGVFGHSKVQGRKGGGGLIQPAQFLYLSCPIFLRYQPNIVSNDIWHLYLYLNDLRIVRNSVIFP